MVVEAESIGGRGRDLSVGVGIPSVELKMQNVHFMFSKILIPYSSFRRIDEANLDGVSASVFSNCFDAQGSDLKQIELKKFLVNFVL